jgi:2-keto-4-pentenoate hydratase/2-oxohepta-3-ene-1,7-dioic acid hydratase in catechol pathway
MVRGVPDLVAYASAAMTLLPGDVILTGTPAGVGLLEEGQRVDVSIDGIGRLVNPVVARG